METTLRVGFLFYFMKGYISWIVWIFFKERTQFMATTYPVFFNEKIHSMATALCCYERIQLIPTTYMQCVLFFMKEYNLWLNYASFFLYRRFQLPFGLLKNIFSFSDMRIRTLLENFEKFDGQRKAKWPEIRVQWMHGLLGNNIMNRHPHGKNSGRRFLTVLRYFRSNLILRSPAIDRTEKSAFLIWGQERLEMAF